MRSIESIIREKIYYLVKKNLTQEKLIEEVSSLVKLRKLTESLEPPDMKKE